MSLRRRQRERQKSNSLGQQNNNFARASRFLYISLPSLHDYDVNCLISRFIDNVNTRRRISLGSLEPWIFFLRIQIQESLPTLDKVSELWWSRCSFKNVKSLFKWRFRRCRRCGTLNSLMSRGTPAKKLGRPSMSLRERAGQPCLRSGSSGLTWLSLNFISPHFIYLFVYSSIYFKVAHAVICWWFSRRGHHNTGCWKTLEQYVRHILIG